MSFPRHAQASRLFLPIFNKEAVISNYSAVMFQSVLYVIIPQITLITLIFLMSSLAVIS